MTRTDDQSKIAVEEVDKVEAPPRAKVDSARVDDTVDTSVDVEIDTVQNEPETPRATMERKRDYLEGFLAKKPEAAPMGEAGSELQQAVIDALKEIYDPEIPVNIYDLGLIYGVEVSP